MLFNSLTFILFGAIFFLFLPLIYKGGNNVRWFYFVLASFFFYGWWDWRYIFLLFISGLIDFLAGLGMAHYTHRRKLLLLLSLTANLGILFSFKYLHFFTDSVNYLLGLAHFPSLSYKEIPSFLAVLPVGISFYTFQSMSYTIDVYYQRLEPTKNILQFFSYLSLFPQLVAGPIVRAKDFIPQLKTIRRITEIERWDGLKLIIIGYFKKIVLADNIAPMVNNAFTNDLSNDSWLYWWTVMVGFAFQIYCDFSGYSDIARGLAKWMGFHFRVNFNHPYLSSSFKEFWSRWHISLSTWFRDYVYIPLGGSKVSPFRTYVNIWMTMLLSGLWHGAGLNFLLWGASHAFYLSVERFSNFSSRLKSLPGGHLLNTLIVALLVTISWVFFRANDVNQISMVLSHMFHFSSGIEFSSTLLPDLFYTGVLFLGLGIAIEVAISFGLNWKKLFNSYIYFYVEVIQYSALICLCIFLRGTGAQFIYFQF